MLALAVGHRLTVAAATLFLALVIVLKPLAEIYMDEDIRLTRGARAEESVGLTLNELTRDGWTVFHDIEQAGEGNVDHLVFGPNGVYMIETKARRYENRQLIKARRQAAKLHDALGVWVTPVICLHERKGKAFRADRVWIVPHGELLAWLHAQRNTPVPVERFERFSAASG